MMSDVRGEHDQKALEAFLSTTDKVKGLGKLHRSLSHLFPFIDKSQACSHCDCTDRAVKHSSELRCHRSFQKQHTALAY